MQTFTGIEYLKIDIANNCGKDKLKFQERIEWFNTNIENKVNKDSSNQELLDLISKEIEPEEIELTFAGLQAYVKYLNNEPSGYMISFDATASGTQIMSALTTDIKGMLLSNLIDDNRHDVYTEVYYLLKEVWRRAHGKELAIPRKNIKQAIMVMMYGGSKSIMKYLNDDKELFQSLMSCCSVKIKGAYTLCQSLLRCIDKEVSTYTWITPDNYHVKTDILSKYMEERDTPVGRIKVWYKDLGKDPFYKGNVANLVHSIDGTLMREVVARCNYDRDAVLKSMSKLHRVLNITVDEVSLLAKTVGTTMNQELKELVDIYYKCGFVSVRCLKYIETESDVLGIIRDTDEDFVNSLYKMAEQMLSYNSFDVVVVHDCFQCLSNNMSYVRYWYKEVLAQMVECNVLKYMMKQLPNGKVEYARHFQRDFKPEVANLIRNSNYAIC